MIYRRGQRLYFHFLQQYRNKYFQMMNGGESTYSLGSIVNRSNSISQNTTKTRHCDHGRPPLLDFNRVLKEKVELRRRRQISDLNERSRSIYSSEKKHLLRSRSKEKGWQGDSCYQDKIDDRPLENSNLLNYNYIRHRREGIEVDIDIGIDSMEYPSSYDKS